MRCYGIVTAAEAIETVRTSPRDPPHVAIEGNNCYDDQQIARHIETAREFYQRFPAMHSRQGPELETTPGVASSGPEQLPLLRMLEGCAQAR
jgi:hypothetical protein